MSLEKLREAILKIPPTGARGFEGLVATLLSSLTGYRFYVARSGDQPTDAITSAGDVAMQTKRYDVTSFSETTFEGEFQKACRVIPDLDCYIFAAPRRVAQLVQLANELQKKEGVDILLLGFDEPDSEFAALCLHFWNKIRHFPSLSALGPDFAAWAANEARRSEISIAVNQLRNELTTSMPVAGMVRTKLMFYLDSRFGFNETSTRPVRFAIHLTRAVPRKAAHANLVRWWNDNKKPAALVIGEEGMGKSVIAAAFAYHMIESSGALVLWLDSADWTGITTIEGVVNAGLKHAGFSDRTLRERLARKAIARWSPRLLLVLDGVNEKSARDAAHHLLEELQLNEKPSCRIVFTSRPIKWASDESALWNTAQKIPVAAFSDQELHQALASLPNQIPRDELPAGLVEIAKIPRYFRRAVELRAQLKSLQHVSKEMVLWVDLLEKIEAGDIQITERIGWRSAADLKRALKTLASAAVQIQTKPEGCGDNYSILQGCFGNNFERTRLDLAEQRIVIEPTGENPAPNREHVILGFALHLSSIASEHSNESIREIADRLRKELEPMTSQDYLTEALFVALQLSAVPNHEAHILSSKARSAFLFAWASSHNSHGEPERFEFWAKLDLPAYLDFIEEIFVEPVAEIWADRIIAPLKDIWRATPTDRVLEKRLRQWLKLVWKSHHLPAAPELHYEHHLLPIARSQSQLTLSNAALAVLAENPANSFLPDLAIAWATDRVSTERHSWQNTSTQKQQTQEVPCKDLDHNLGPVMRWRFTEFVKPKVQELLAAAGEDGTLRKGCDLLLISFDRFGWRWSGIGPQHLRDRQPIFPDASRQNRNFFVDCPELAARDDLPSLSAEDQSIIAEKVEQAFSSNQLRGDRYQSEAGLHLDNYLAWFAKFNPERLAEIGAQFRLIALCKSDAGLALDLANDLPYLRSIVATRDLLRVAKELVERSWKSSCGIEWSLLETHVLAFTCFGEAELEDWLTFSAGHKVARRQIHFYPIPILSHYLLRDSLASFAREQAKLCCDEAPDESEISSSKFDFWAAIGGVAGEPNVEYHQWVDAQIRARQPTGQRTFYWRLLWFRSAPQELLQQAVADGSILDLLSGDGMRAMIFARRSIDDWSDLSVDFGRLVEKIPLDDVGTLLLAAHRQDDLSKWGHLIFGEALNRAGHPSFERKFWGETIYTRDDSGRISNCSFSREQNSSASTDEKLRPEQHEAMEGYLGNFDLERREQQTNAALKIWREDLNNLKIVDQGAFGQFSAFHALEAWRDQHPAEFRHYASEFLGRAASDASKAFHLAGFIAAVLDALSPLEPDAAFEINDQFVGSALRVNVINDYGQPTFAAALWRSASATNVCSLALCKQLVETSNTDEELASHAILAQAEGALEILLEICDELLAARFARDRALAVSLLAWVPNNAQIAKLLALSTDDPSGWIRTHANWAAEVARHEQAVRNHYRTIVGMQDRNAVLAGLQVLLPALTLSALSWHRQIEAQELTTINLPPKVEAALAVFWYNFRSRSKKAPKIFGRDLREYLRGECIRDLRVPKPRLLGCSLADEHSSGSAKC